MSNSVAARDRSLVLLRHLVGITRAWSSSVVITGTCLEAFLFDVFLGAAAFILTGDEDGDEPLSGGARISSSSRVR